MKLRKLDAAYRQLETALELYFSEEDLVSAWTLAAAAYNLVRDLGKGTNLSPMMLKEQLPAKAPAEIREALTKRIQETENFLKHADKDADAELDFQPEGRIELLLFDAALRFRELAGYETALMVLMRMWFLSKAKIKYEHKGKTDDQFDQWIRSIQPHDGETPLTYRIRLYKEASRNALGQEALGELDK